MKFRGKWRKLFVKESGSFAELPWVTRACGAQLLKLADDDGRIELRAGSGDFIERLVNTIAWRVGATAGDKRVMRTAFAELVTDRYLVEEPNHACIRNFAEAQVNLKRVENESKTKSESSVRNDSLHDVKIQHRIQNETRVETKSELSTGNQSIPIATSQVDDLAQKRTKNEPETKSELTTQNHSIVSARLLDNKNLSKERETNTPTKYQVPSTTSKVDGSALNADEILLALKTSSNGKFNLWAGAQQMAQLMRFVAECFPQPTLNDFELLGKAHAEGQAWPGFQRTPDLGLLLRDSGSMLLSGLQHAREWQTQKDEAQEAKRLANEQRNNDPITKMIRNRDKLREKFAQSQPTSALKLVANGG